MLDIDSVLSQLSMSYENNYLGRGIFSRTRCVKPRNEGACPTSGLSSRKLLDLTPYTKFPQYKTVVIPNINIVFRPGTNIGWEKFSSKSFMENILHKLMSSENVL